MRERLGGRLALLIAIGALGVAALAVAGCGSDDSGDTSAATTTEEAADGGGGGETVDVSLVDFKLDPADPTVKAGEVTFKATNNGETTHSLEIEGPGEETELPQDLAPGDSGQVTVDLSKPGNYEWYCPIDSHKEMGMQGEITVQ
jgi:uncharacterized cupredoxin-like copper-binding protein